MPVTPHGRQPRSNAGEATSPNSAITEIESQRIGFAGGTVSPSEAKRDEACARSEQFGADQGRWDDASAEELRAQILTLMAKL